MDRLLASARALCLLLACLTAGTALGGCARGGTTTVKGRTVAVTLDEYTLTPQNITISHGSVTIIARNRGRFVHDLAISKKTTVLGRTSTMGPGDQATLRIVLGPGIYRLFSSQSEDDTLGINSFLTVT